MLVSTKMIDVDSYLRVIGGLARRELLRMLARSTRNQAVANDKLPSASRKAPQHTKFCLSKPRRRQVIA